MIMRVHDLKQNNESLKHRAESHTRSQETKRQLISSARRRPVLLVEQDYISQSSLVEVNISLLISSDCFALPLWVV